MLGLLPSMEMYGSPTAAAAGPCQQLPNIQPDAHGATAMQSFLGLKGGCRISREVQQVGCISETTRHGLQVTGSIAMLFETPNACSHWLHLPILMAGMQPQSGSRDKLISTRLQKTNAMRSACD